MIALKIVRDKAREVQRHFFPYLVMVCEMRIEEGQKRESLMVTPETKWEAIAQKLSGRLMWSLIDSTKRRFDRKLLTDQNKFTIKMTDAEGICFYQLLMNMPIDPTWVYAINLRREITDYLSGQLCI